MYGIAPGNVEGITVLTETLLLVAVMELGDKTQIVTISLAARGPWALVLAGAAAGLVATTAIGAVIGGILAASLGPWLAYIKVGGGLLFIGLAIWSLVQAKLRPSGTEEESKAPSKHGAFGEAFLLNFLAEFGDKTQLAVIILAASYAAPVSVFLGASLALSAIALLSVVIGLGLARVLSERWLRVVSTALFLIAGVLLILEGLAPS